ncbi:MAG: hypothetical protein IKR81_18415, partial [Victivallales bacterium]|nr:hypothetical protein [Victivallales bacterium]
MKNKVIYFPEKEKAALQEVDFTPELAPNQVLARCECSAISAGTELANFHALPNTGPTGYVGMAHADLTTGFPCYPGSSAVGGIE